MSMPAAPTTAQVKARLTDGTNPVDFNFNPESITITHRAPQRPVNSAKDGAGGQGQAGGAGGAGGSPLAQQTKVTDVGVTTIALSDLIVNGSSTVDTCKRLLGWSYPASKGRGMAADLPLLTFTWGTALSYKVTISSVDIIYERFTPSGQPVRAKAKLTLQYEGDPPPGTNPTSGGIPGRRSHILVAGENLQHVAMANYGKPGAWRALAAANGIEDPLAVQPGTVIYLPAPAELANGGSR
jgi:nucleoid-associated protein YgaU